MKDYQPIEINHRKTSEDEYTMSFFTSKQRYIKLRCKNRMLFQKSEIPRERIQCILRT